MINDMKQKQTMIWTIVVIILAVVVGFGFFFFISKSSNQSQQANQNQGLPEMVVPTLAPSDIGLSLKLVQNGQAAEMSITNMKDITAIDYELSYVSKGNITRGITSTVDLKPGQTSLTRDLLFGTCSDVCHYDEDVSQIKLVLKITKSDGKVYQVTQTL